MLPRSPRRGPDAHLPPPPGSPARLPFPSATLRGPRPGRPSPPLPVPAAPRRWRRGCAPPVSPPGSGTSRRSCGGGTGCSGRPSRRSSGSVSGPRRRGSPGGVEAEGRFPFPHLLGQRERRGGAPRPRLCRFQKSVYEMFVRTEKCWRFFLCS